MNAKRNAETTMQILKKRQHLTDAMIKARVMMSSLGIFIGHTHLHIKCIIVTKWPFADLTSTTDVYIR